MPHHGEFKVPGGKLVVADFSVEAGRLAGVRISGDFFLFPDEALDWINAAVNGASADATEVELALRIRAALPTDVEMIGFTPESVAAAIRRGMA